MRFDAITLNSVPEAIFPSGERLVIPGDHANFLSEILNGPYPTE